AVWAATRTKPSRSTSCGGRRRRPCMSWSAICAARTARGVRGYPYKRSHLVALRRIQDFGKRSAVVLKVEEGEMKQVQIAAYGMPESVAQCVDVEDVGVPDASEVIFEVLAFPINPADINFCLGIYRTRPPLPAVPGAECVGRVLRTGAGVTSVKAGDLVINL